MKHTLPSIVLSSILSAAVTAAVFWTLVPRPVNAQASPQTVVAQRISIVDDQGRERISLGQSPDYPGYELRVLDTSGQVLLTLGGIDGLSDLSMSSGGVPWKLWLQGSANSATNGLTVVGACGTRTTLTTVNAAGLDVPKCDGSNRAAP